MGKQEQGFTKWMRSTHGVYRLPVKEGEFKATYGTLNREDLEAMFETVEVPRDRFYSLKLVTTDANEKDPEEIVHATLYVDCNIVDTRGDVRLLLKYSDLVEGVKGIPKRRIPGFRALIGELQDRVERTRSCRKSKR